MRINFKLPMNLENKAVEIKDKIKTRLTAENGGFFEWLGSHFVGIALVIVGAVILIGLTQDWAKELFERGMNKLFDTLKI